MILLALAVRYREFHRAGNQEINLVGNTNVVLAFALA